MVRRFSRNAIVSMAATLLLLVGVAPPSNAASSAAGGSFDWTAVMYCCVDGRHFDTATRDDIWVDIDSISPSDDKNGDPVYVGLELWRDKAVGAEKVGSGRVGRYGDYVWRDVAAGEYWVYIYIREPAKDDYKYTVKGSVAYDSRRT